MRKFFSAVLLLFSTTAFGLTCESLFVPDAVSAVAVRTLLSFHKFKGVPVANHLISEGHSNPVLVDAEPNNTGDAFKIHYQYKKEGRVISDSLDYTFRDL